jgi:hypothetical protein
MQSPHIPKDGQTGRTAMRKLMVYPPAISAASSSSRLVGCMGLVRRRARLCDATRDHRQRAVSSSVCRVVDVDQLCSQSSRASRKASQLSCDRSPTIMEPERSMSAPRRCRCRRSVRHGCGTVTHGYLRSRHGPVHNQNRCCATDPSEDCNCRCREGSWPASWRTM